MFFLFYLHIYQFMYSQNIPWLNIAGHGLVIAWMSNIKILHIRKGYAQELKSGMTSNDDSKTWKFN